MVLVKHKELKLAKQSSMKEKIVKLQKELKFEGKDKEKCVAFCGLLSNQN